MSTRYSRAPIIEAVIDLRTLGASEDSVALAERFADAVADMLPERQPVFQTQFVMIGGPTAVSATANTLPHGLRLISSDKQRVAIAHREGLVISHLAPYASWEVFQSQARKLWDAYRVIFDCESVVRAALRYINRIDIPDPLPTTVETYLTVYPCASDVITGGGGYRYFMQLQAKMSDIGADLVLNTGTAAPAADRALILDIDLSGTRQDDPWSARSDDAIWSYLEVLRERKNSVFESAITDELRDLIL